MSSTPESGRTRSQRGWPSARRSALCCGI
jgi:hypothetical protein